MVCIPGGKGIGQYRHIKLSHRDIGYAQRRTAELAARTQGKERGQARRTTSVKSAAQQSPVEP